MIIIGSASFGNQISENDLTCRFVLFNLGDAGIKLMAMCDRQNLQLWQTEAGAQHCTRGSWYPLRHCTQFSSQAEQLEAEGKAGSSEDMLFFTTTQAYCESCSCALPRWKGNILKTDFFWILPLREHRPGDSEWKLSWVYLPDFLRLWFPLLLQWV